jgi:hypothetical protein
VTGHERSQQFETGDSCIQEGENLFFVHGRNYKGELDKEGLFGISKTPLVGSCLLGPHNATSVAVSRSRLSLGTSGLRKTTNNTLLLKGAFDGVWQQVTPETAFPLAPKLPHSHA